MKAIRVHSFGGPEVLKLEEVSSPKPRQGEAVVATDAIGLNYIDVYHRTGFYPNPLPFTPGREGAGRVVAVGPGVDGLNVGDQVAWAGVLGSYSQQVLAPAAQLVPIPKGLDPKVAAALMLQGMTAHYLSTTTYPLKRGDSCLIHAAAGGVGLLLVQMAKDRGARVFGTVSTDEKARLAREAGADEVILYTKQDFQVEVKRLTDGKGVSVVYDSVGKTTFEKSLESLAQRGMLVLFGQSSGAIPPFDPLRLNERGSLFLTRPTLNHYTADRASLLERASAVLGAAQSGKLKVRIDKEFPLAEASEAHTILESRGTTGKVLLIP